jgi:hypothetical protein
MTNQNNLNEHLYSNNKFGVKGVCMFQGKYMALGRLNGKSKYLGSFNTKEEAGRAYQTFVKNNDGESYND